ncbi:flocculation protein FLO11-like [Perca fluviatilis]|uniref:flocculation protein FLO11-like n=1 Tax=Perca fluviatilis TaxID=8168 RepID=UPI0019634F90|nr:flocculation protein FLO11-like [Perca fluviatilis]XP_039643117.1 flocculation protein FLO11-like [Perca fluviatilis]
MDARVNHSSKLLIVLASGMERMESTSSSALAGSASASRCPSPILPVRTSPHTSERDPSPLLTSERPSPILLVRTPSHTPERSPSPPLTSERSSPQPLTIYTPNPLIPWLPSPWWWQTPEQREITKMLAKGGPEPYVVFDPYPCQSSTREMTQAGGTETTLEVNPADAKNRRKNKKKDKKERHLGAAGELLQPGPGRTGQESTQEAATSSQQAGTPVAGGQDPDQCSPSSSLFPSPLPAVPASSETRPHVRKHKKKRKSTQTQTPSNFPAKMSRGTQTEPEGPVGNPVPTPVPNSEVSMDAPVPMDTPVPVPIPDSQATEESAFKIYQFGQVGDRHKKTRVHPRATGDPAMWKYFTHVKLGQFCHNWTIEPSTENMDYFIKNSTHLKTVTSDFPDGDGECIPVDKHWHVFTATSNRFLILTNRDQDPLVIILDYNKL